MSQNNNPSPKRNFFGWVKKEENKIAKKEKAEPTGLLKYLTIPIILFFSLGLLLIVAGSANYAPKIIPRLFHSGAVINPILKSLGGALIGSGVFTVIIKSSEYSKIFSNIIGEIIWSKKFIEKRSDKNDIWSMVSRLIYNEKFPLISDEIEEIITTKYFPTEHQYYIEDYSFTFNVTSQNENFYKYVESITFLLKATDSRIKVNHNFISSIDLPFENIADDTNLTIDFLSINGEKITPPYIEPIKDGSVKHYKCPIQLYNKNEYKIILNRTKVLCKKTNPDKRFFATSIIKNMKITCIYGHDVNVSFNKMGTINDFENTLNTSNNGVNVYTWEYKGLVLPEQGFIILFK